MKDNPIKKTSQNTTKGSIQRKVTVVNKPPKQNSMSIEKKVVSILPKDPLAKKTKDDKVTGKLAKFRK